MWRALCKNETRRSILKSQNLNFQSSPPYVLLSRLPQRGTVHQPRVVSPLARLPWEYWTNQPQPQRGCVCELNFANIKLDAPPLSNLKSQICNLLTLPLEFSIRVHPCVSVVSLIFSPRSLRPCVNYLLLSAPSASSVPNSEQCTCSKQRTCA